MPVSTPGMSQCYMVALTHLSCSRAHLFSNILCPIVDTCHQGYACLHFCHAPCCPVASWTYLFVGQPCPVPPHGCDGTPDYEPTVSPAIVSPGGDRPICSSAKTHHYCVVAQAHLFHTLAISQCCHRQDDLSCSYLQHSSSTIRHGHTCSHLSQSPSAPHGGMYPHLLTNLTHPIIDTW